MTMGIGQKIGRRIKELREARGLTQVQLAAILGKSVETISNFERGKVLTSLHTLEQLARHLNARMKDFFDDEAPSHQSTGSVSRHATTIRNAVNFLPEDDLEIVAGLVDVLETRRRHSRG